MEMSGINVTDQLRPFHPKLLKLLDDVQLLVITGRKGIGKTELARHLLGPDHLLVDSALIPILSSDKWLFENPVGITMPTIELILKINPEAKIIITAEDLNSIFVNITRLERLSIKKRHVLLKKLPYV